MFSDFVVKNSMTGNFEEKENDKLKIPIIHIDDSRKELLPVSQPKVNKKENKKQRAILLNERNKLTSSLKKEVELLEADIMDLEDVIETEQHQLIHVSNSDDNSRLIELSTLITKQEKAVEEKFERLEISQTKLDEITQEYNEKIEDL